MSARKVEDLIAKLRHDDSDLFMGVEGYDLPMMSLCGLKDGRPSLLIIVRDDLEIPEFTSSEAVNVSVEDNGEGGTYLFLTVTDVEYEELFGKFCADLLSVMDGAASSAAALSRLARRYASWRKFLRNKRGAMSENQVRGLAGELLYFRRRLDEGMSPTALTAGWLGPEGGDQDFVFRDSWAEIKTVRQSASEVEIASLEQLVNPSSLEEADEVDGRLVVIRLHGAPSGENSFTLSELYGDVLKKLPDYPREAERFMTSVDLTGADMQTGDLETKLRLQVVERSVYQVNKEGFPRIVRDDKLPSAVTKLRYKLSIPALEPWKIED